MLGRDVESGSSVLLDRRAFRACEIAASGAGGLRLTLQHQAIVCYMARLDALPAAYGVHSVQVDLESGEILLFYATRDERLLYVIERWNGCEFRGSSDWMAAGPEAAAMAGPVRCEAVVPLIF